MMRTLVFLLLLVVSYSCSEPVPKNVLDPHKMAAVQWDMMQADEIVDMQRASDSAYPAADKRVEYYQQVLAIHRITKEKFDKSLDYYAGHPKLLKNILDSLQRKGERIKNADDPRVLADSLKNKPAGSLLKKDSAALRRAVDSLRRKKFFSARP
jgi:hypothetical protein